MAGTKNIAEVDAANKQTAVIRGTLAITTVGIQSLTRVGYVPETTRAFT